MSPTSAIYVFSLRSARARLLAWVSQNAADPLVAWPSASGHHVIRNEDRRDTTSEMLYRYDAGGG